MAEAYAVQELASHQFSGQFPQIGSYETVDLEALLAGDDEPLFITLAIAEIGRVSANGLLYDGALVSSIADQLRGSGGIRGHIPDGQESSAFPIDAVDWVGHEIIEGQLWAKAYVRPGETRDHIRRLKARGGSLGTSIYGFATREEVDADKGIWRAAPFELHSVDLAPAKMASLQLGGAYQITSETRQASEDGSMNTVISINQVPEALREEIIEQARLVSDLSRVADIQTELEGLRHKIAEFETQITERETRIAELVADKDAALLRLGEYEKRAFQTVLAQRIAERTDWQVQSEAGQSKLASLRERIQRDLQAEMGQSQASEALEAALTKVWDENAVFIETIRESLSGPNVSLMGQGNPKEGTAEWLKSDEGIAELKKKYGAR